MSHENADPFNPWAAARAATAYMLDAWYFSALYPWMPWIKMMAEAGRKNSVPASARARSVQPAPSAGRRITEALDLDHAESFDGHDGAQRDAAWLERVVREATCA